MKMLKLKDNIELKELEKFKFELNSNEEYELIIEKNDYRTICVVENDRSIYMQSNGFVVEELSILYDLIKANLVEKIEEVKENE